MSLILSIVGILIVFSTIDLLVKLDEEVNFKISNKEKGVLAMLMLLFNTIIYIKYEGTTYYWFYYYLIIYLTVSAYIDYKIQKVYCFLNYITMVVSLGLWVYQVLNGVDTIPGVTAYIFFSIISFIFRFVGAYASGDNELFIATGYIIASIVTGNILIKLFLIMLLSSIILPILNFKQFSISKIKFHEGKKIAFIPAIMLSTMIVISL